VTAQVHFHAYSWTGGREELEKRKGERHPGSVEFNGSTLPTEIVADALLRPAKAVVATFTEVDEAARWLSDHYRNTPQVGPGSTPDEKEVFYVEELSHGADCVAGYYTRSYAFVHASVVCCPNRFKPEIRCPAPTTTR
jgi:hypothetical protein